MFLVQKIQDFLKETFQSPKNSNNTEADFLNRFDEIEKDCGLDPNDTSSDPAFHSLMGNTWHGMFPGDD
jgi:hypothetical protein